MVAKENVDKAISSVLASKLSDADIRKVSNFLKAKEKPVVGFDPCIYGICINYGIEGRLSSIDFGDWDVDGLGAIQGIDILIDGIVLPERTMLKVRYNL